jgi:HSP20 family molecular chaperone IbpA
MRPEDAHEIYDWLMAESEVVSVPPAELLEKNDTFEMRFAVAGLNPDDVHVMVTPEQIAVRSQFKHDHADEAGTVHWCDFKSATIFRSIKLPHPIDVRSVNLDFADGLLVVTAAKQGEQQATIQPPATAVEATQEPAVKRVGSRKSSPPKKSRSRLP